MRSGDDISSLEINILYAIAGLDEPNGQDIKRHVEEKTGERMYDEAYYTVFERFVESGFIEKQADDGRSKQYSLTDDGRERLEEHHRWACEQLDNRE